MHARRRLLRVLGPELVRLAEAGFHVKVGEALTQVRASSALIAGVQTDVLSVDLLHAEITRVLGEKDRDRP
jgi:hypothetical protein